jgi:hypothetical protein
MMGRILTCLGAFILCGCGHTSNNSTTPSHISVDHLERTSEKGPVKLTIRVTPAQPRLSDLVEMDVHVTAQPDVEVKAPVFGQAVGDFLVRDYSERKDTPTTPQPGEPITHRFHYQLEPVHAGRHLIRSLAVEFIDNRPKSESRGITSLIESDPLEVQVISEFGDQLPSLNDLDPMLPPQPLNSLSEWKWLALATLVGSIALSAIWLRRRRKSLVSEPPRKTPEEIAHSALAELLAEQLPSRGLVKEFYLRLTGIVRQFIEGTTGLKAPEQTTEEFLRAMRTQEVFPAQRSARLKEFLEAADMVKYAGQEPDADQIELSIARAREFIDVQREQRVIPPVSEGEG